MCRSSFLALVLVTLALSVSSPTLRAGSPNESKKALRPLADLARDLSNPDREKRYSAAEDIREHYKGKAFDALPQVIAATGNYLDQPHQLRDSRLYFAVREIVREAGPGRVKAAGEATHHTDARIRAAGFFIWAGGIVCTKTNENPWAGVDPKPLLAAIRRGMKDKSPLVRSHAIGALMGIGNAPVPIREEAMKLLIAALDDRVQPSEDEIKNPATYAAAVLASYAYYGVNIKPALPALIKAAAAEDRQLVNLSCTALHLIAKTDKTVAEDLIKILTPLFLDKKRAAILRCSAVSALPTQTPGIRWIIEDLAGILQDPTESALLRRVVITAIERCGPRAAPAVPALIDRLEKVTPEWERVCFAPLRKKPWMAQSLGICFGPWLHYENVVSHLHVEQSLIVYALKTIGPAAAPASQRLKTWMEKHPDPRMRSEAYEALKEIEK